jgi:hypothetical protein
LRLSLESREKIDILKYGIDLSRKQSTVSQ